MKELLPVLLALLLVYTAGCEQSDDTEADTGEDGEILADADEDESTADMPGDSEDGLPPDGPPEDMEEEDAEDEEELVDRGPFALAVLPDTQYYSQSYPDIFTQQTEWIRDSREEFNFIFVLHEGDITDDNVPFQWVNADTSMTILDGHVPYSMCLGNHDLGPDGSCSDRTTLFNDYFPVDRYESEDWYGGHMGDFNNNHYTFFDAAGLQFMILSLEFGPPDYVLDWANDIVTVFREKRVIVLTHCYMYHDETRVGPGDGGNPHNYGVHATGANDGEEMWEKFVQHHENIFLVLSGHITGDGAGRLTSTGTHGNEVHQLLADYQSLDSGGFGWLRIMEFAPHENLIYVTTFSPKMYEESGGVRGWMEDPQNMFTLDYDMAL